MGPTSGVAVYTRALLAHLAPYFDRESLVLFFDSLRVDPAAVLARHGLYGLRAVRFPVPKRVLLTLWRTRRWPP